MATGIGAGRFHIRDGRHELWGVGSSMVLGLTFQTIEDTIVAAVQKHPVSAVMNRRPAV
jgi:hypothetical protein